uniref:Uncharacterized protein n=1 Tax=Tanacetum cinerariifolium TaxID=118510 RepID=A0A699H676_TANCI|nr:hypothetical protein [Tanacetum cinerariifolium]
MSENNSRNNYENNNAEENAFANDNESNNGANNTTNNVVNTEDISQLLDSRGGETVQQTYTRLKILLNDLENKDVKIPQAEVNAMFVNRLPRKWLSMNQTQRANNAMKNESLATLLRKYNYEEDEGTTIVRVFMAISKDEPSMGNSDARVGHEQIPSNIDHALDGKGKKKDEQSSEDIVFVKAKDSPTKTSPKYKSNNETVNDNRETFPPLPKHSGLSPLVH